MARRNDRERRRFERFRKDLEEREQRLAELEETERRYRALAAETQASQEKEHSRADGVEDKIDKARTALDNAHASEVADCAHQATLEALTKAQLFLAVLPYVTENVVRAYDDIDELIKSAGRDQEQARKVWKADAEDARPRADMSCHFPFSSSGRTCPARSTQVAMPCRSQMLTRCWPVVSRYSTRVDLRPGHNAQ